MAENKELKRIYRIEVQGIEQATKKVEQLTQEIQLQNQIKKEAQKILLTNPGDVAQIEKQSKVIAESEIAIKKLSAEKRIATKEADALIRFTEKEALVQLKTIEANGLAIGSYKQLYTESKRLNDLYRSTAPTSPLFEKIKAEAIAAQQKVHDFNRTLSSEGTLVGEYSRGIINAFKSADLGNILREQVKKGEGALKELDNSLKLLAKDYKTLQQQGTTSLNSLEIQIKSLSAAQNAGTAENIAQLNKLESEYNELKTAGTNALNAIERELLENRQAALRLGNEVGTMKSELKSAAGVGTQLTTELRSGFQGLTSDLINTAIAYAGIQAAISATQQLVRNTAAFSDSQSELEINLGKTRGGVDKLTDALSKLDTRTKLIELEEIANIAVKAGVSEENLLGVTEAIDKVKVAFGKDFGDVEKGTEAIVKIINIFEGKENLTGEKFTQVGNAIRTLANESVASVPYLNDFAQRIAGLEGIANVGLASTLGLASGFEQFGQSAETSSTVLIKLVPKLATETEKFAKYAGLTGKAFKEMLESDPTEALIRFSEGIVKNKSGLVELEAALQDSEIFGPKGGGRGVAILGTLGKNADEFRKAITSAKGAIQDTSAIQDAFNKKNENFAAVLDKISKKFADLGNNKTLQAFLLGLANVITFLLGNFQILIPLLLTTIGLTQTWAGNIIRLTAAMILEKAALVIETAQLAIANGVRAASNALIAAYTYALSVSTTATGAAAVAARVLAGAIAFLSSPIGIVIGLVVALTTVFGVLSSRASDTSKSLTAIQKTQIATNEVNKQSNLIYAEQIAKIDSWIAVIKSAAVSADTKANAVAELIKIDARFSEIIKNNVIDLGKLDEAYKAVTKSIIDQANVKASADLSAQANRKVVEIATARQVLERRLALKGADFFDFGNGSSGLPKEILDIIKNLKSSDVTTNLNLSKTIVVKNKELVSAINELKKLEKDATDEYIEFEKIHQNALKVIPVTPPATNTTTVIDTKDDDDKKKKKEKHKKTAEELRDDAIKRIKEEEDTKRKLQEISFRRGLIDEITYAENLNGIVIKYSNLKLAVVEKAAKEEQNRIAEFNLDKVNSEKDTNEKVYKLKLDALKLEQKTFVFDPKKTKEENAQAKIDVDKFNLAAAQKYQLDALSLKNQYHIRDIKAEKDWAKAIKDINEQLNKDLTELDFAKLEDSKTASAEQLAEFKAYIAAKRLQAIEAGKSTEKIDKEEKLGIGARELGALNAQMPIIKKLFNEGLISAKEYYDFLAERDAKAAENFKNLTDQIEANFVKRLKSYRSFKDLITGEIQNFAKQLGANSEVQKALGDGLNQAYQLASEALNSYYNNKQQQIDADKKRQLEALEVEKNIALDRAQSRGEEVALEKRYRERQTQIEKQAFEEQKKIKKSQARIAFLTELANIWSSVWQIGNPIVAAVLGALYTGLAVVRYNSTVKGIDAAKFEKGGWLKSGGEIKGRSHAEGGIPFSTNDAEVEGGELAIINKKSTHSNQVFSVTGTPKQIASAINEVGGGKRFESGARTSKLAYGGTFGSGLKTPGNTSFLNHDTDLKDYINAVNQRIDNIKVIVVAKEVEKVNNNTKKAEAVGTL